MPRKPISDKPMTPKERARKRRKVVAEKLKLLKRYQERFGPLDDQHEEGEKE